MTLPRNGILVLSETYYPGWIATVDRYPAKILVADYVLRGVEVPPGKHRVRFAYRPKSVQYGTAVSLTSIMVWAGVAAAAFLRRRRARAVA